MGWERATLRRQPASFVRALIWRLYAPRRWSPELAAAAATPVPLREQFPTIEDWGKAYKARTEIVEAQAAIEALLFPEDDDGR